VLLANGLNTHIADQYDAGLADAPHLSVVGADGDIGDVNDRAASEQ
jgi:hypothetical protein